MAKKFLMGNEAFAHAALEAGASVIAGYPGTPSSEVIETIAKLHSQGAAKDVHVEWSCNEKAALELAAGAAISGKRALFTCKQVGLNVASDALMSLNYVGVKAGLVIFVADDPGPISSQTEQDTRRFAAFAKVPVLDPATPEQGFQMMKEAFELSEKYKTPVIVRPTTRIDHASTFIDIEPATCALPAIDEGFLRDPSEWVIFPRRSYRAHGEINERLKKIADDFSLDESLSRFNPTLANAPDIVCDNGKAPSDAICEKDERILGIVCGGVSTQYAKEALSAIEDAAQIRGFALPPYKFLQIGTPYPFPEKTALEFLNGIKDVLVLEELDSVIEEELIKVIGSAHANANVHGKLTHEANERGENSTEDAILRISAFFDEYGNATSNIEDDIVESAKLFAYESPLPMRAPVLCAGCPHRGAFYAVKRALSSMRIKRDDAVFCGDIGCYTLGNAMPLDACDTCLCMGAGITMAEGMSVANPDKKAIAFIGDSTFFASGMTGVANAVYNQHDITICVLDNSTTAMTGSQPHPGTGQTLMGPKSEPIDIASVLKALGVEQIAYADPLDHAEAAKIAKEALEIEGPSAIIFKSPCIWLVPFDPPFEVIRDKCTGCKRCVSELGCPAISFRPPSVIGERGFADIDESQCNGCSLCSQICPFDAIQSPAPSSQESGDR